MSVNDRFLNLRGDTEENRKIYQQFLAAYLKLRVGQRMAVTVNYPNGDAPEPFNLKFEGVRDGEAFFSLPLAWITGMDDNLY